MSSTIIDQPLKCGVRDDALVVGESRDDALPPLTKEDRCELAWRDRRVLVTDNLVDMRPLHYEAITPGGLGDWE
jgi:hypothetical protein